MFLPLSHRQFHRRLSDSEARLCHEAPPGAPPEVRSAWDPRRWMEKIAYGMTWAGAEIGALYAEAIARIPKGIVEAIYNVAKEKLDVAQDLIRRAVNFTIAAPGAVVEWVSKIFTEQKNLSPEAMANFMDLRLWVLAFDGLRLTDPVTDAEKKAVADEMLAAKKKINDRVPDTKPDDYLKSLTPFERRQRFATLTMSIIPKDAQATSSAIFGDADPTKRIDTIAGKQSTLVLAMQKMYGLDEGRKSDSEAQKIAKESLTQLLFLSKTGTDKAFGASGGLKEEFLGHIDRRPGMMTPEGIKREFAAGKPEASLLLGAVTEGVLTQTDIDTLVPQIEEWRTKLQEESQKQRQLLEKTTKVSQLEIRKAAETMSERFSNAPGWLKFALALGLVGGVMKFPKTALACLAVFAGKYFLLKDDNPLDSTGNNIKSVVDTLRGAKAVGPLGPSKAVQQLGEQVIQFLPGNLHENMNASVTGFTLLAGIDVSVVATHFDVEKDGRLGWLRAWEPPVRDAIKSSLKERSMDTAAAGRFFPSTDTREKDKDGKPTVDCTKHRYLCETGDALASYFYLLGADRVRKGEHQRKTLDMATLGLIEQARTSATASGYYDDIDDNLEMVHPQAGKPVNIRQEYYEVIREGIEEGKKRRGQTMEEVMLELAASRDTSVKGATPYKPLVAPDGPAASTTGKPSAAPTGGAATGPTGSPSAGPTGGLGARPTGSPAAGPTGGPSSSPTGTPSAGPTGGPSSRPTGSPASSPTGGPTSAPTGSPASGSMAGPAAAPTRGPSLAPAGAPVAPSTGSPSSAPAGDPLAAPTGSPMRAPAAGPTVVPSGAPAAPSAGAPSRAPVSSPAAAPAGSPSEGPVRAPRSSPAGSPEHSAEQALTPQRYADIISRYVATFGLQMPNDPEALGVQPRTRESTNYAFHNSFDDPYEIGNAAYKTKIEEKIPTFDLMNVSEMEAMLKAMGK